MRTLNQALDLTAQNQVSGGREGLSCHVFKRAVIYFSSLARWVAL